MTSAGHHGSRVERLERFADIVAPWYPRLGKKPPTVNLSQFFLRSKLKMSQVYLESVFDGKHAELRMVVFLLLF